MNNTIYRLHDETINKVRMGFLCVRFWGSQLSLQLSLLSVHKAISSFFEFLQVNTKTSELVNKDRVLQEKMQQLNSTLTEKVKQKKHLLNLNWLIAIDWLFDK